MARSILRARLGAGTGGGQRINDVMLLAALLAGARNKIKT